MNIMNIAPIFINVNSKNNQNTQNYNRMSNPLAMPKYKNQLTQDTVSFTAAKFNEHVYFNFKKEYPRFERIATTYLDTTEAVANQLKAYGVKFVREMFEATAIKEPDSRLSKVTRAKTFESRDLIRTTVFMDNPYDVSVLFDKIIPEYKKRGYNVANIDMSVRDLMEKSYIPVEENILINKFFEMSEHTQTSHTTYFAELRKKGYEYAETKKLLAKYLKEGKTPSEDEFLELVKSLYKSVPDIDIRLQQNKVDRKSVPQKLRHSIGKPQKSGYEDIQLRFIRDCDLDKEYPVYHELLIQFGPTYNINARQEHKQVYEPIRLFKELHVPIEEKDVIQGSVNFKEQPLVAVEKFITDIKDMFREKVSVKLITNGKNKDYFGIDDEEEIFFTESDVKKHNRLFNNLIGFLCEYYKQQKLRAKDIEFLPKQLSKDFKDDLALVNEVKSKLDETIHDVNYAYGLKDNG